MLPNTPRVAEQRLYVKALEERVAELELNLSFERADASITEDHWERLRPREDLPNSSLSHAIRDLSLNASGYYVGATSNLTLGRLLATLLPADHPGVAERDEVHSRSPPLLLIQPSSRFSSPLLPLLFDAYLTHVSIQLPLMHSRKLRELHMRRASLQEPFEVCIMHLVYAIGGRCLEFAGRRGDYDSDGHYEAAMEFRDVVIQYIDRRSIIYLALATVYCLRAPRSPGAW